MGSKEGIAVEVGLVEVEAVVVVVEVAAVELGFVL